MEKNNQVEHHHHHNGVMRLPPGFRFHPTDEELVVHYLIRKALSCPLPASLIPEIDLAKYNNPWDLPGSMMQDKYFFAQREAKYQNGNRANRATGSGYWKATGKDRAIVASRCNQVVGMKKVLVFYRGKHPNLSRTSWIMYEYRLALAPQRITSPQRDWVVCHIFTKKRRNDVEQEQQQQQQQQRPSGSESSCVTEGMDESNHGEDISSSSSSSPP